MPELIIWRKQQLNRLRRDMDRMIERMLGEFSPTQTAGLIKRGPSIDLVETDQTLVLRAEIPGVDPKNLEIDITDNVLTIDGEIKQENIREDENYHRVERNYGSFSRSIQLPCRIVLEDVKATYRKGVLKIVMPKCRPEEARRIKVKLR
jgi:HSP20 family protein